ncbi:hypothetical protein BAE44_0002628, partial [Dichanthelium oligosanthes]
LYSRKELKLIPLVLLASLLLLLQFQTEVRLLQGRRFLLIGRHGEAIAKGLMEPVVANGEGGEALVGEDKREVITGPNPLHNRR